MSDSDNLLPTHFGRLEAHPLAALFRRMDDAEFEALKASIRASGVREPIRLYEGKILDGRNRYAAALEVGYNLKACHFIEFVGTSAEAEAYVLDTNAKRRQMSDADKAKLVERMIEKYPSKSDRAIARLCGVSHVTVGKYRAPKIDKDYERFALDWGKLNDTQRKRFARAFSAEIHETWTS